MFGNNNSTQFNRPPSHGFQYGRFHPDHNSGANENYGSQPNYPPTYGNFYSFQQNRYQLSRQYPSYEGQQPAYEPHQQIWPQQMGYLPTNFQPDGFQNQFPPNAYIPNFNGPFFGGRTPYPNSNDASGGMPLYRRNTASPGTCMRSCGSFYGLYTSFDDKEAPTLLPVPFNNEEEEKVHDLIDLTGDDEQSTFSGGTIEQQNQENLLSTPIVQYIENIISEVQIENSNVNQDVSMIIDETEVQSQDREMVVYLERGVDKDSESSDHSLVNAPRDSVLCYGNKQVYVSVIKVNPSRAPNDKCCNKNSDSDIISLEEKNLTCEKIIYVDCNNNSGEEEGNYHYLDDKRQSIVTMPLQGSFQVKSIFETSQTTLIFCMRQICDLKFFKNNSSVFIFSPYVYHVSVDLHFFSLSLHTHSESFVTKLGSHEINICAVGNLLCLSVECSGTSKANTLFSSFVKEIRTIFFHYEKLNKIHCVLPKLKLKDHVDELLKNNVASQRAKTVKSFVSEVHWLENFCEGDMSLFHSDVGHDCSHSKKNYLQELNVGEANNTPFQKSHLNLKQTALFKIFNDKCTKPAQALERSVENLQCHTNEKPGMVEVTSGMYLVKPTSIAKAKQILKLKYVYMAEPPLGHENHSLLFTKLHIDETELLGTQKHVFEIIRIKNCPKNTPCVKEQEQYRVRCVEEEKSLKLLFTKENSQDVKFIAPTQLKEKTLHMAKTETGFKYVGQEPVQYVLKKLGITLSASPQSSVKEGQSEPAANNNKETKKKTMKGSPTEDKRYVKKAKLILIRKRAEMVVKPVGDQKKADDAHHLKDVKVDQPDKIEKCISDSKPLMCDIGNKGIGPPFVENRALATSKQVRNIQVKPISRLLDKVKAELDKSIGASTSSMIKICNNIQYIIKNSRSVTVREFLHQGVVISDAERRVLKHFCKESNLAVCDIISTYAGVRNNFKDSLDNSSNRKKIRAVLQGEFKKKKWGKKATAKRLALLHKILSFHQNCKEINERATQDVHSKMTAEEGPPVLELAEQSDADIFIDIDSPPVLEPEVAVSERFLEFNTVAPIISSEEEGFNIHTQKGLLLDVKLKDEECSLSQNSTLLSGNVIDSNKQMEDLSRSFSQSKIDLGEGSNDSTIKCSGEELNKEENSLATAIIAIENLLKLESEEPKNHASEENVSNTTVALDESLKEIINSQQTGIVNEFLSKESLDQIEFDKKSRTVISLQEYESRTRNTPLFRSYHSQYSHHDPIMSPQWLPPSPRNDVPENSRKRRNSDPNCSGCDPRPCKACGLTFEMHINGKCNQLKVLELQKSQKCPTYVDPARYSTIASSRITREDVDALKKVVSEGDITLYAPEKKTFRDPRLDTAAYVESMSVCTVSNLLKHASRTDTESPDISGRKRARSKPREEVNRQCWGFLDLFECSDDSVSSPEFEHPDTNHKQLPFETKPFEGITSASQDFQTHTTLDFELGAEASTSLGIISESENACPLKKRRKGDDPYSPSSPTSTISST